MKDLRSEVAALKNGGIGGSNQPTGTTQSGVEFREDVLLQCASDTGNNTSPSAKKRKENGIESYDEANDSSDEEDNTLHSLKQEKHSWRLYLKQN